MNNYNNTTRKLNVLVVDDNEDICKVISSILQVKGCETTAARTCEDAFKLVKTIRPDMVCCDIRLKGKTSGLDLARILRADKETAHLFLIAVSAHSGEQEKGEALQAGFDMFFPKPIRFSDLTRAIETFTLSVNLSTGIAPSPSGS